jgi:cation diffusion facilitator CzcD-associated flavoprotein CzcO
MRPAVNETATNNVLDVLIVGAGLSGIDAAYRLQTTLPHKRYAIVEARDAIGGTWDLFRYPGVRSDSDMYTLGFPFRPWQGEHVIAGGGEIRDYIRDTAAHYGIDQHIRFGHRVKRASWSTPDAMWTVELEVAGQPVVLRCAFLIMCSGYYDYARAFVPNFPGVDRYRGRVVQPQFWPEDLDHAGKRVVVIGSGATAVTLVPALAHAAAHVTMLQRSPSYIVALPAKDRLAAAARRWLPTQTADAFVRWKNVLMGIATFSLAKHAPRTTQKLIARGRQQQMGPGHDDRHFTPSYKPWEQRVCVVPDGDLFETLRSGRAEVVTDQIETFTETGIKLASGQELAADIVVSATGLVVRLLGGATLVVDGETIDPGQKLLYKGMMLDGVPNLGLTFGYSNASWTLKCDLIARYLCRLLGHMERTERAVCVPRLKDPTVTPLPLLDFSSGYVARAVGTMPQQGSKGPWRLHQNYVLDFASLALSDLEDGTMELFARGARRTAA